MRPGAVLSAMRTGLGYNGGTGNPGEVNGQYGWHVQVIEEAADHTWAKVKIWNAAVYRLRRRPRTITTPGVKTFTYTLCSIQRVSQHGSVTMTRT